ncbi:hypothetical protein F4859DRAFT_498915 [Xylaria cf. heliscus]|nr:hypothetical protein F4859DRAFT_498915 [Xylaria cf. heliscus]
MRTQVNSCVCVCVCAAILLLLDSSHCFFGVAASRSPMSQDRRTAEPQDHRTTESQSQRDYTIAVRSERSSQPGD